MTLDSLKINLETPWATTSSGDFGSLASKSCVFISPTDLKIMNSVVAATQRIFTNPQYKEQVTGLESVRYHGLFCGYDFHLTANGPKLIEINTNAGGALLNYHLALAQKEFPTATKFPFDIKNFERVITEHFLNEWKLSGRSNSPKTIGIVDDRPQEQFLYQEFLLFQKLLQKNIAPTYIIDAQNISYKNGGLYFQDELDQEVRLDFIYNRLTDFYLSTGIHLAIKNAYHLHDCVISPAPIHHALYANKDNLIHLRDSNFLKKIHADEESISILTTAIPKTELVSKEKMTELWNERKHLFFKPGLGYGSKAVYRGDKITHKVFEEILSGHNIAQEYVPAAQRLLIDNLGEKKFLKFDIRLYTYGGTAFMAAARLYDGQATNFRTKDGGFAVVYLIS